MITITEKKVFLWIVLAFMLIALADFFPRFTVILIGLLITSVLLVNYNSYLDLLKNVGFTPSTGN